DEVALPAPSLARLDAERVPGVPARRQLRAQRLVDAHLRARAGRPRVLARIDARGGKHLWSLAGPGRFYIGPIWRALEVSLHLLDLCEELPSRVASARPGSAQSWAWALNVATSASNPTASQGRPALQVTGEHREEPLEPPAPRGHAARADSARFATFAGSGPSTRSHRSRRGSVGATACRQHGSGGSTAVVCSMGMILMKASTRAYGRHNITLPSATVDLLDCVTKRGNRSRVIDQGIRELDLGP